MEKIESIQEFYKRKLDQVPGIVSNEIGHFNLFRLEPYVEGKPTNIPYRRRDFYKIMLVKGNSEVHFADRKIEVKRQALSFSNPFIHTSGNISIGSAKASIVFDVLKLIYPACNQEFTTFRVFDYASIPVHSCYG